MIQEGKYKDAQGLAELNEELNALLKDEPDSPEALCPLKALEVIAPNTNTATRKEAVQKIITLLGSLEDEIKKLEAIDEDLLTDDDKDKLKKLDRKWNACLEPTVRILKSDDKWIGDVGQPAIKLLIESLKVSNPSIQKDVLNLLVSLKDQSFEELIRALKSESEIVRRQAVIALGNIGDERAVEPITNLLSTDDDPGVRYYVPVALDMIGGEKKADSLRKALGNEMAQVRMAAIDMLGDMEDEESVEQLIELLADDNSYVKSSANNALLKIGGKQVDSADNPVVVKLINVLNTEAKDVDLPETDKIGDKIRNEYKKVLSKRAALQVSAASILGEIKDPKAINPLLKAMKREADGTSQEDKSNAESVRAGAAAALTAMGPAAVESLIDILKNSESENARVNAASTLGSIGDKRAVEPLIEALQLDKSNSVRASSAASLGTLKDRRATDALIKALHDEDVVTRANAAISLGTMNDKTATEPLIEVVMNKEEREKIREAAIISLGTLKDAKALETLLKVVIDEYEKDGTRKTAMSALRTMEKSWPSEALIALLKGEIVYGVFMPKEGGKIERWFESEGEEDLNKDQSLAEVSIEGGTEIVSSPSAGTLVKIYVQAGEKAAGNDLIGLVSFKDKEIEEEERSSIRSAAASALGKVKGEKALEALMYSARKDKSAAVRKNAVNSIWELDKAEGRPALIKALDDDIGVVRSTAALGLGKGTLKGEDCVSPLIDALRDKKYEATKVQAAWALGEIKDKRSVDTLIDAILAGRKGRDKGKKDKIESDAVIDNVVTALDKIAGPAVDPVIKVLEDTDVDEVARSNAARVLGLIEDVKATDPLIATLADKSDENVVIRSEAAKSLGLITDRRAVDSLIEVLADENEWVTVRTNAATSLGQIKDERGVEPLIAALKYDISAIRGSAVVALGLLKDKRATMPLVQILENETEDDAIRADAISSLVSIGDKPQEVINALMTAFNRASIALRQNAVAALGDLSESAAVEPLINILENVNEPVTLRANAAEALGNIGDKRASSLMVDRLGDRNESDAVWKKVAEAAAKLQVSEVSEWVAERANDGWEPAALRSAAFMALTSSVKDFTILEEMLGNSTKEIRAGAALALGESGRKEAVPLLVDKLKNDGEEIVRRDCAKGLAKLADPDSEQALIEAHQNDAKESVKIEAAIALGNIKGREGIAALINTVQDTSIGNAIRWNAATALGASGSSEAAPALQSALEENIGNIHFEAAEALRKISVKP